MTLVAPAIAPLAKGLAVAASQTAPKTTAAPQTEAPRTSAGEVSAANLKAETVRAVDPAGQSAVAPRLRDQETTERSNRLPTKYDAPTGPQPAFEESLLQRRSRKALDPPEFIKKAEVAPVDAENSHEEPPPAPGTVASDTPPTPSEKAEAGFAETRAISDDAQLATLDVKG